MKITDNDFKQKFEDNCFKNNSILLNELLVIIQHPNNKYLHEVLNLYYKKEPEIIFDTDLIKKTLELQFSLESCHIQDFSKPFFGGKKPDYTVFDEIRFYNNQENSDTNDQNWYGFIGEMKKTYWNNLEKTNSFKSLMNIVFYEDRLPKTQKEKLLALNQENFINWGIKQIKYFDIKNVMTFYSQLVEIFFPDFKLIKTISSNKIKRFAKKIDSRYYIGLYFDFNFIASELKKGYLELPHIRIDFFSESLKSHLKENYYLVSQDEYQIVRVSLAPFIGHPNNYRIGNSSEEEIDLKKNLFYYFDIYSSYLRSYLNFLEMNFKKTLDH